VYQLTTACKAANIGIDRFGGDATSSYNFTQSVVGPHADGSDFHQLPQFGLRHSTAGAASYSMTPPSDAGTASTISSTFRAQSITILVMPN
jgi:hypothetical protein